jgi:SNF2 family DNA or RNA helicase
MKDQIKSLRGGRWSRKDKVWKFPATPHAAQQLIEAFPYLRDDLTQLLIKEVPFANSLYLNHFETKLWEHQQRAVDACYHRPASMLAMEMRTGKTAVSIALAALWDARRIIVTCPISVVGVWQAEVAFHTSCEWVVVRLDRGSVKAKTKFLEDGISFADKRGLPLLCIVNHESIWREPFGETALGIEWDLAIVDESHRAKAPGGKFSRYLSRLADRVPRRLALTGTPLPHSPLDAYAQYRFLDRSIYGSSFNRFKTRHAVTGGFQNYEIIGWQHMEEFSSLFHEIAFECTTDEAFDLPEEMDIARSTQLEPTALKTYLSMEEHFWAEVEKGEVTAANALVKLLRLQQMTSGWVKDDMDTMQNVSTAKEKLFEDVIADFPTEMPFVVFVRFTKDIEVVREVCESQGRRVGEVSGQRKDLTDAGTFPEDLDVMVCQIQSGSLGVNLSRASTCIFYSWGWSLGDVEQARARIRHSDNVDKLQFIHLIIEDSIDERMMGCLKTRKDFIEDILEKGRDANGSQEESHQEENHQEEGG